MDGFKSLRIKDVRLVTLADIALGGQLVGELLDGFFVQVERGDLGAGLRVSASHFAAEHAARTGDNDNFTGKINIQRQIHSSSTSFQSVVFKEIYRLNGAGRITR